MRLAFQTEQEAYAYFKQLKETVRAKEQEAEELSLYRGILQEQLSASDKLKEEKLANLVSRMRMLPLRYQKQLEIIQQAKDQGESLIKLKVHEREVMREFNKRLFKINQTESPEAISEATDAIQTVKNVFNK